MAFDPELKSALVDVAAGQVRLEARADRTDEQLLRMAGLINALAERQVKLTEGQTKLTERVDKLSEHVDTPSASTPLPPWSFVDLPTAPGATSQSRSESAISSCESAG